MYVYLYKCTVINVPCSNCVIKRLNNLSVFLHLIIYWLTQLIAIYCTNEIILFNLSLVVKHKNSAIPLYSVSLVNIYYRN